MTTLEILSAIRGLIHLWVSLTSFSLYQLYRDGYRVSGKESRIITSLTKIFFWISVVFGFFAVASFAQAIDIIAHEYLILFAPVLVLPLGFLITKFRQDSVREEKHEHKPFKPKG